MTPQQILAVQMKAKCILEAIEAADELGAPSGLLYAGVMKEISLSQYQQIMGQMQKQGFITHENDCYKLTASGNKFLNKLKLRYREIVKKAA